MKVSENRTYKLARAIYSISCKAVKPYSSKFSRKDFTQPQHLAISCLKRRMKEDYRDCVDMIGEMPRIMQVLELQRMPHFTAVQKAFHRLSVHVFVVLLYLTASAFPGSGIYGMDATGFPRSYASRHYTKRCKMKLKALKVTFIVDSHQQCIVGAYITVTRKHDTRIMLCLIRRVNGRAHVRTLIADRGYDSDEVRKDLRKLGIRPIIKHREFSNLDKAHNMRLDKKLYCQRAKCETVNSAVKRKFGDSVYSRKWQNQFKEIYMMSVLYNSERSCVVYVRFSTKLIYKANYLLYNGDIMLLAGRAKAQKAAAASEAGAAGS